MVESKSFGSRLFDVLNYALLFVLTVVFLYPLWYVLVGSISDPVRLFMHNGLLWRPLGFSLQGYRTMLQNPNVGIGYANTIFYVVVGTVLSIFFSCLGAYTLSRPKLMFKKLFTLLVVFTMYFSGGMIPKFLVVKGVGLYNTRMAVILPGVISTWNMIVMRTSFRAIPQSLEESARLDGAGDFTILFRIIVPCAKATIAVMVLYYAVAQWNGWFSKWEGEPRFVGDVEGLEKIAAKNALPAKNWERIFGNPAKAALLDRHPATICAGAEQARILLDLFSESLLLNVNPLDAWEPTFTTSRSESDAAFLWRASPDELSAPVNLSAKSAPPAPQSRAAQYAATGVMTNREKYNLKVSAPKPATRLQVVETKQTDWKPLYIASAAVTLCALAAAVWLLLPASAGDSAQPSRTPSELPTLGLSENSAKSDAAATESQKPKSAMTLSQTMEIVRGKIAEDRYGEALKFWDESPKAAGEPSLRRDILEDIGTRADVLMRQAENLLALESPSKPDIEKARKNLEKAARALDIAGMGRIEARTAKLKTLNDRISTK